MHPFSTPWKYQKTKVALGTNGLIWTVLTGVLVWLDSSPETVVQRCSAKNVFLEISQNSQKNTCARVFLFNKVATILKTGSGTGVFLWILRYFLLQNTSGGCFCKSTFWQNSNWENPLHIYLPNMKFSFDLLSTRPQDFYFKWFLAST